MDSTYLIDNFLTVTPGEAIRLFPFGEIHRSGKVRRVTPELAAMFNLPHFRPAIKLGSHNDSTPAGGHLTRLEVRADGLYGWPEWNDAGRAALEQGAYRYHSPEVIWEGALENVTTGEPTPGPLIVGLALLHTPALGEAAALYQVQPIKETVMSEETVQVPRPLWDRFLAWFDREPAPADPAPDPDPEPQADQLSAVVAQRDEYRQRIEELEAEQARRERLSALTAEIQNREQYGSMYIEAQAAEEAAQVLAGMTDEQRVWVLRNFRALVAQVDEGAITGEVGSGASDPNPNPIASLVAAIQAVQAEKHVSYEAALVIVRQEQPDLFAAAYPRRKE